MAVRRLVALVVGLAAVVAAAAPATAAADAAAGSRFVSLANDARAVDGLPALGVRSDLQAVARRHAVRMADEGRVFHNPDLPDQVGGWQRLGENVGKGPTVDEIHEAFMSSASHRRNILDGGFTEIGVGVEVRDGVIWVAEVFREPLAGRTEPASDEPAPSEEPPPAGPAPSEPARPPTVGLPAPLSSFAPAVGPDLPIPPSSGPAPAARTSRAIPTSTDRGPELVAAGGWPPHPHGSWPRR